MLDVASVRYFSGSLLTQLPEEKEKRLPLKSRLRTYLRGRQQTTEMVLEKLVNIDTHVRNIEGVNKCSELIKSQLAPLNFSSEIYPELEIGNLLFLSNSNGEELDYLILMPIDDSVKMSNHENFQATEHRLYGTSIWENKGGIVTCISAFQALRFARLLRKIKIGVLVLTDSTIAGKFSRNIIAQKAIKAKRVISLHGGNIEGSIITSRSGSASYTYNLKLVDSSSSENVALAASHFFKTISAIVDLGKNDTENVIAPFSTDFQSNFFKMVAYGTAKISVRFNTVEDFDKIDQRIRKTTALTRRLAKMLQSQLDGGLTRQPLPSSETSMELYDSVSRIAKRIDSSVVPEHRWSSSDICNISVDVPKLDGFGPIGGFDKQKSEFIIRHSLVDRALLLALLLQSR
jgi:D-alanine-D-alanine ligase